MRTKNLLNSLTFCGLMTIFVVRAEAGQLQSMQIVFKGSEAKMSMNLFKFQLKNKVSDLNLNLKFIATEKEVAYDVTGLKKAEKQKRLHALMTKTNNCEIIKETEPDQMAAFIEYRDCLKYAFSSETVMALNSRPNQPWRERVASEKKITLVREEMVLEGNVDSDTAVMLSSLAGDVQQEVNNLNTSAPNASEITVIRAQ